VTDPHRVRLAEAWLCLDCSCITAAGGRSCLVCGSSALLSLARVLHRLPMDMRGVGATAPSVGERRKQT